MYYWIAVLIPPFLIIFLNILLRLKYHNKIRSIGFGLFNASIQVIGYSFGLMAYDNGLEKYSLWAPINLLTISIPIFVLFLIISIWIRLKK